jgi:vacuolar-type H+-ATPase subunit F/Vma7
MSRLVVVTRPSVAPGYRLAGVETFAAEDAAQAQQIVTRLLDGGENGLLAIDEEWLAGCEHAFRSRLDAADQLPHLAIPSGEPLGPEGAGREQLAELIRRAVGFQITFRGAAE